MLWVDKVYRQKKSPAISDRAIDWLMLCYSVIPNPDFSSIDWCFFHNDTSNLSGLPKTLQSALTAISYSFVSLGLAFN